MQGDNRGREAQQGRGTSRKIIISSWSWPPVIHYNKSVNEQRDLHANIGGISHWYRGGRKQYMRLDV